MMNIEGHWETVNSLEDVSKIIREYYNHELADKMDELIEEIKPTDCHYDDSYVEELEDVIEQIRNLVG